MDNNNNEGMQEAPQTDSPEQQPDTTSQEAQPAAKINKKVIIGGAVVLVALIAGISYLGQQIYQRIDTADEENIAMEGNNDGGEVAGVADTGPVAIVNGSEISRNRFDFRYNLEAKNAPLRGLDLSDANSENLFSRQVLDNVVTVELLLQEAEKAGITASQESIDAQYQVVIDALGGEEAFKEQLATENITEEGLYNDIREQLIIENFVNYYAEKEGIEVTDEEVQEAYDNTAAANDAVPAFEEVSDQIRAQLMQQKSVEAVNQYLESLKDSSDIKLLN